MPVGGWHGAIWPIDADVSDPGTPSSAVSVVSGIAQVELTPRSGTIAFYAAYSAVVVRPTGNPSHSIRAPRLVIVSVNLAGGFRIRCDSVEGRIRVDSGRILAKSGCWAAPQESVLRYVTVCGLGMRIGTLVAENR
jgi:hypothetical protein